MQIEEEHSKKIFGISVYSWYFVGGLVFALSMLSNYRNGLQFNGIIIFAIIWVVGIILLEILPRTRHYDKLVGTSGLGVFWMENPDRHVIWILPVGFIGVLGCSFIGSIINQPIIGIFGSGIVMLITLFYTRSILIPIIIHGAFNTFVVVAQTGLLGNSFLPLAVNPSFSYSVPTLSNSIPSLSPLISEVLQQLFIVAPSEEVLKVFALAGFIIFFKGDFVEDTKIKWLAGLGAVITWTSMHMIAAL